MSGLSGIDQATLATNYSASPQPIQSFAQELGADVQRENAKPERTARAPTPVAQRAGVETEQAILQRVASEESGPSPAEAAATVTVGTQAPVSPIGITEAFLGARIFGLHLRAQGYLSELGAMNTADDTSIEAMQSSWERDVSSTAAQPSLAASNVTATHVQSGADGQTPWGVMIPANEPADERADLTSLFEVTSPLLSESEEAVRWAERALHFSRDGGHGVTAWLRDYRLGAVHLNQLLDTLTAYAREQGVNLRRVVLNGREIWTSATPSSKESGHGG